MDLFLDPGPGRPLAGQLREGITQGRLLPGDQLTPSRQLAAELGVSRHTVTTAYSRLAAEGYTEGRAGGGSVVAAGSAELAAADGSGPVSPPSALRPARRLAGLEQSFAVPTRRTGSTCAPGSPTPGCSRSPRGGGGSPRP